MRPAVTVALGVALLMSACSHPRVEPGEPQSSSAHEQEAASAPDGGALVPGVPGVAPGTDNSAVTPAAPPAKVKIFVRTTPPKIFVHWGKKKLGLTPLTIERPRDSGPVDLVIRGVGFFPVHARAYTVHNDVIAVKMVKLQDRMTIFGAKAEIPPDVPDGGTTPPTTAPPAPAPPIAPAL